MDVSVGFVYFFKAPAFQKDCLKLHVHQQGIEKSIYTSPKITTPKIQMHIPEPHLMKISSLSLLRFHYWNSATFASLPSIPGVPEAQHKENHLHAQYSFCCRAFALRLFILTYSDELVWLPWKVTWEISLPLVPLSLKPNLPSEPASCFLYSWHPNSVETLQR